MATSFENLKYLSGFGNEFATEDPRCPGALPPGQNNPQVCPYGLYAEQLNGTSFTTPRESNKRSWLYRIRPTVTHYPYKRLPDDYSHITNEWDSSTTPNQILWKPFDIPPKGNHHPQVDFIRGIRTICGAGDPKCRNGIAIYIYTCNAAMDKDTCFSNADGDLLIMPQQGTLDVTTEFGLIRVEQSEFCVIPQGIRFNVSVEGECRGYILEVFGVHFVLPQLGCIGANGLANPRDFLTPVAWYEDRDELVDKHTGAPQYQLIQKYQGALYQAHQDHSTFDVVAWHGNYVPYKYNMANFCPAGFTSFDHVDPSVFVCLTAPSSRPGVAVADFGIFPPQWMAVDRTFRPPWYHRNCMVEFMGQIYGDLKERSFRSGGCNLHSIMAPHGPDANGCEKGLREDGTPERIAENSMVFMFETSFSMALTKWAANAENIDPDYYKMWQPIKKYFTGEKDVKL